MIIAGQHRLLLHGLLHGVHPARLPGPERAVHGGRDEGAGLHHALRLPHRVVHVPHLQLLHGQEAEKEGST